jgi:hypothetical protein
MMTSQRENEGSMRGLSEIFAALAACIFIILATYRIQLPGLYYDEVNFVNAAQGAPDKTFIYAKLGPIPLLIMPYLGALKAWIYAPIFYLFKVSPLTIRLPVILLAAVTLLILYRAVRHTIGALWAAVVVSIMAVDPANLFLSRLDWGPTVLMHFFQALILALLFSYRRQPQLWKAAMIFGCFALGFFDKFNFVWFLLAFAVGIAVCYPDSVLIFWSSVPRSARWPAIIIILVGFGLMTHLIMPLIFPLQPTNVDTAGLGIKWQSLLSTLSGQAVAGFVFGKDGGITPYLSFWLIMTDFCLALACLFCSISDSGARENRRNGLFCLIVGFLIFVQIAITPQAGGPHHYSMIFPLPLLAFGFLARSLYRQVTTRILQRLVVFGFWSAATCIFLVNVHNTATYLSQFRTNLHYNPRWSPEIYSLSKYINAHGFDASRVISVDWGLHTQLHALAPKKLRLRMRDFWRVFRKLGQETQQEQSAIVNRVFPQGTSFVLTFAASKETFPETRQNFLALSAAHPELKFRLAKQFWFAGEKIYELYEVIRSAPLTEKT